MSVHPTAPLDGATEVPRTQEPSRRLDLGNGEWVRVHAMTIGEWRSFLGAEGDMAGAVDATLGAVEEAHFNNGKSLDGQPMEIFTLILSKWNEREDEVALPPANGQSSASPS